MGLKVGAHIAFLLPPPPLLLTHTNDMCAPVLCVAHINVRATNTMDKCVNTGAVCLRHLLRKRTNFCLHFGPHGKSCPEKQLQPLIVEQVNQSANG